MLFFVNKLKIFVTLGLGLGLGFDINLWLLWGTVPVLIQNLIYFTIMFGFYIFVCIFLRTYLSSFVLIH